LLSLDFDILILMTVALGIPRFLSYDFGIRMGLKQEPIMINGYNYGMWSLVWKLCQEAKVFGSILRILY
jgi:hypothetical protein